VTCLHAPQRCTSVSSSDAAAGSAAAERAHLDHRANDEARPQREKFWQARAAAADVEIAWSPGTLHGLDTEELASALRAHAGNRGSITDHGDADAALARAEVKIGGTYEAPYLAQAPLEPNNGLAQVVGDAAEIWAPTQTPTITLVDGVVQQRNFDTSPALRMHESPEIVVEILASDARPTGVGEPGLPPIAPAAANAMFQLTGVRLRKMPLQRAWNERGMS
jgi:CO/xanthine dehydrogenase Mo-binding subunit